LLIPGSLSAIPACVVHKRATTRLTAWLHSYLTVKLYGEMWAIRTHVGAVDAAYANARMARGARAIAAWFAIGDIVQTYEQFRNARALPANFTHISLASLLPGTVLNVGRCGPLFGKRGGGEQAEYLEGPAPVLRHLDAWWSRLPGHA